MEAALEEAALKAWSSNRLIYRALETEDAPTRAMFLKISNDPVNRSTAESTTLKPRTEQEADVMLQQIRKQAIFAASVHLIDGGYPPHYPPIGLVCISPGRSPSTDAGTIRIALLEAYQDQGYGTEALRWIVEWGFRFANLHRIDVTTYSYNQRAIAVFLKVGFIEEGRRRQAFRINRTWYDIVDLAMLEHEWEASTAKQQEEAWLP